MRRAFGLSVLFWSFCAQVSAKTIIVDGDGAGDFTEIQPALDAAGSGDTVLVRSGEYEIPEPLDVNLSREEGAPNKSVTLLSEEGAEQTVIHLKRRPEIAWNAGALLFRGEGETSTLRGFTVTGDANGIRVTSGATPTIENCIVWNNGAGSLWLSGDAEPVVSHSCLEGDTVWPGEGNTSEDPRFCGWGDMPEVTVDGADSDDNGRIEIADSVRLLAYAFQQGEPLPAPFLECGSDATIDELLCVTYPSCSRP